MIQDKGSVAVPSAPASSNATPNIRQSHSQRDNFADSLKRQEGKEQNNNRGSETDGKSAKGTSDHQKILAASRQNGRGGQEEQSGQRQDGVVAGSFTNAAVDTAQITAAKGTSASALPNEISAHIEKIAAAIQEMAGQNTKAQFELHMPLASIMLQSAVLGRDATGNIAIQLQGQGRMPEAMMQRISASLAHQLRQRKLRIGEVAFTEHGAGADKNSHANIKGQS